MWRDKSVMVVDDDEALLRMLAQELGHELGAYTVVARDGDEAIEWAERLKPTLILLDLMLPGKDGFEVARLIKSSDTMRDILIVAVSGATPASEVRQKALDAGCDDFVRKPFLIDDLLDRVHHWLQHRDLNPPVA